MRTDGAAGCVVPVVECSAGLWREELARREPTNIWSRRTGELSHVPEQSAGQPRLRGGSTQFGTWRGSAEMKWRSAETLQWAVGYQQWHSRTSHFTKQLEAQARTGMIRSLLPRDSATAPFWAAPSSGPSLSSVDFYPDESRGAEMLMFGLSRSLLLAIIMCSQHVHG